MPPTGPSCFLFVSDDLVVRVVGAAGQAAFTAAIPLRPTLLGLAFHHQALVPDPVAGTFGAVMSDAMTATIGGL
jgi:hypothetical protein